MNIDMKYLPLYKKWVGRGYLRDYPHASAYGGLCGTRVGVSPLFLNMFAIDMPYGSYWAYDGSVYNDHHHDVEYKFTPTRQNIVLLLAAMNNEL